MTKEKSNVGLGKIILTAILTAILTTFSQSYLQNRQQKKEIESWKKMYNIETVDRINDTRIGMLEEINENLLQLEVQAKEIKIEAAAAKYYTTSEQVEKLNNLLIQYNKDLYRFAAKTHIASFFYGNSVDSLIPILGEALEYNFQSNLLLITNEIEIPEFNLDFETTDSLTINRNRITQAMAMEIMESYKLKE